MAGDFLKLSIAGASHASALRFTLLNFPAGVRIDRERLAAFMARRAPGKDRFSTARQEADEIDFLSGFRDGLTDGSPIVGRIANRDVRSADYGVERTIPRPGHADFGQWIQYGFIPPGGGSNSGRLTAPLCAVGGLSLQFLLTRGITVSASVLSIAGEASPRRQDAAIDAARKAGDSVGGIVTCAINGVAPGFGGALFDGLESSLSAALFAIPGVKGVEFGEGFACAAKRGSAFNDAFVVSAGEVKTRTNRQGGIMGGRATGAPIVFRVAFRPTPTVFRSQSSVDLATMRPAICRMKGRHDPCIVRRAVPVVEAAAAFVMADAILANEAARPRICLTLTGKTLAEDREQFDSQRYFTDMVELRVDLLRPSERAKARQFARFLPHGMPFILTKNIDHTVLSDGRIIRPLHDFNGPVRPLLKTCRALSGKEGAIAKIAYTPHSLADVARAFHVFGRSAALGKVPPHVVLAMGPMGLATRVLAGRLGSLWTYCSTGGLEGIGHISPAELVKTYRFRSVTRNAALYGVTGFPLAKTLSPEIHNAAFAAEDVDAVMIPFPSRSAREALAFMKAMGMKGLAVTIPHKERMLRLLDRVSRMARRVGAVNTIALENGKYVGYNTDVAGFTEAITAFAGNLAGKRVAILGDGGAAQAVKRAFRDLHVRFAVFHRRPLVAGYDLIVNATPVDPIPDYVFDGHELVYDLGYLPEKTPLLDRAAKAGCRVENGLRMLESQAREQRRIWGL